MKKNCASMTKIFQQMYIYFYQFAGNVVSGKYNINIFAGTTGTITEILAHIYDVMLA